MKRQIILATTCMTLFGLSLRAQEYSVDELKQRFRSQYVEKYSAEGNDTMKLDVLQTGYDGKIFTKSNEHCFLYLSEMLRTAGKIHLPPSRYVQMGEKLDTTSAKDTHQVYYESTGTWYTAHKLPSTGKDGKRQYEYEKLTQTDAAYHLYWQSIRDTSDTEQDERLRNALRKKYGCVTLADGTILIPAKWFSGEILAAFNPFVYGNTLVTDHLRKGQIKDGEYLLDNMMCPSKDEHWYSSCSIMHDANDISLTPLKEGQRTVMVGTPSGERLEHIYRRSLTLFARDINRCIDKRLLPDTLKKEYDVMLYLDENNKAHLYPLLSYDLTNEDKLLLSTLSTAVEQQPTGTFGKLLSARGPFPAIYLRVRFSRGKWERFHDFRFLKQSMCL